MIYECTDCGKYFTEDQIGEKQICYEEYYGVSSDFNTRTYDNVSCCPHCHSTNYEECDDDEEIVKYLNRYVDKTPFGQKLQYNDLISKELVIVGGRGVWRDFEQEKNNKKEIEKQMAHKILKLVKEYDGNIYDIVKVLNEEDKLNLYERDYYDDK